MYAINIYQQLLARLYSSKWEQLVWTWKDISNNFKSSKLSQVLNSSHLFFKAFAWILNQYLRYFTIRLWMTFGATLEKYLLMAASANIFYVAIDYENKTCMEVVANNINIKIHQLFSKQRILRVCVTIYSGKSQCT